jgi:hypothetical protein
MPTLQRPVLHLAVSTQQGPELHLDLSTLQRPVLQLDMSTPEGPELHLDLVGKQEPVQLLDMSHSRGVSCTWMCLLYTIEACAAPGGIFTTGTYAASDLDVPTLERPVLHLDMSTPQGPELHLDLFTLVRNLQ